jgi:putative transposase
MMIDLKHPSLSIRRQCELLELNRSTYYYQPAGESAENLRLMRLLDQEYTQRPFYGYRKMTVRLSDLVGYPVNHKRVARLMRLMGLVAVVPQPGTSTPTPGHKVYPYLLKGMTIGRPNQVWSADITYVPMTGGFMYLVAVLDWYSRFVLAWALSNTLDTAFCLEALSQALLLGTPAIFNTDQGSQFTAHDFINCLQTAGCRVSMDGRGRVFDNIFIERLWRTVKYEDIYLNDYATVPALTIGLDRYFHFYNHQRPHQSLQYRTPADVHFSC